MVLQEEGKPISSTGSVSFPQSEQDVLGSLDDYMSTLMVRSNGQIKFDKDRSLNTTRTSFARDSSPTKKTKKLDLEKAIHEKKEFGRQFLQDKALRKYQHYLEVWDQLAEKLSQKVGKPKVELAMESHEAYRLKKEEIDFLEASIPEEKRHHQWSWELSLRSKWINN